MFSLDVTLEVILLRESLRKLKTTVLLFLGMDSFNMAFEVRKIAECFTTMRTLIVQQ